MKLIATALFAGMLAFGTAACAKEEPKKATAVTAPVATPAPADVKKDEAPKTKRVCIKTTDPKTQKEVEKCRTVKIHEKHEGTKVPEKAPKK
jgi:type IV pilus biogenesis protein CpaD/CtpE